MPKISGLKFGGFVKENLICFILIFLVDYWTCVGELVFK